MHSRHTSAWAYRPAHIWHLQLTPFSTTFPPFPLYPTFFILLPLLLLFPTSPNYAPLSPLLSCRPKVAPPKGRATGMLAMSPAPALAPAPAPSLLSCPIAAWRLAIWRRCCDFADVATPCISTPLLLFSTPTPSSSSSRLQPRLYAAKLKHLCYPNITLLYHACPLSPSSLGPTQ